jgi:hypothetical protein
VSKLLKNPVSIFVAGVLVGYMFSRTLDNVPGVNQLPKIRVF